MSASTPTTPSTPAAPPVPAVPTPPLLPHQIDLLVAAGRERTVLVSGFLAGVGVFFAPLVVLALGLLAAYLAYVASDGRTSVAGMGKPFEAAHFRAVFAPAVDQAPLLVCAGLIGAILAQVRRWLARRAEPVALAAGSRPFFPEFGLLYVLLIGLIVGVAALRGGWVQVHRLASAAPIFLLFMLCATWLAHAVWQYCFRNIVDLLASGGERAAAVALRNRARGRGAADRYA